MNLPSPINRQEMAADLVVENASRLRPEPIGKLLLRAGFPKSTAKQPSRITKSEKFLARLKKNDEKAAKLMVKRREEALKLMEEKQHEAKYRDLAYAADIMTKNQRLLTGQATENVAMQGSLVVLPSKDAEFQNDESPETA